MDDATRAMFEEYADNVRTIWARAFGELDATYTREMEDLARGYGRLVGAAALVAFGVGMLVGAAIARICTA